MVCCYTFMSTLIVQLTFMRIALNYLVVRFLKNNNLHFRMYLFLQSKIISHLSNLSLSFYHMIHSVLAFKRRDGKSISGIKGSILNNVSSSSSYNVISIFSSDNF